MNIIKSIIRWIVAGFFLILCLGALASGSFFAFLLFLLGAFIASPILKKMLAKKNLVLKKRVTMLSLVGLFLVGACIAATTSFPKESTEVVVEGLSERSMPEIESDENNNWEDEIDLSKYGVYLDENSIYYHTSMCEYAKNGEFVNLEDATQRGFFACNKCNPSDANLEDYAEKEREVAQAKAEIEAKQKAEAEVKAQLEAEEKAKAEAEVKIRAEAEAKAKAEAEAKMKAEAETKAKMEAEAKMKAEAEAKAKAEAEAKIRDEAEAERIKQDNQNIEASSIVVDIKSNSGGGGGNGSNFDTYNNPEQQNTADDWVLNTNTMKVHEKTCKSVKKIAPQNYATSSEHLETILSWGYSRCGICKP